MQVSEGYLPYLGYQTYYRIVGDLGAARAAGVAPLVLVHGGPGSAHDYFEVLDDLAGPAAACGIRAAGGVFAGRPGHPETGGSVSVGTDLPGRPLVMYDQLGCGKSYLEGHPELWHMETWLGEFEALIARLGLTSYHLLGQSWGGMLAIQYACDKKPAGLRSLILSSTLSSSRLWGEEQRRMIKYLSVEDRAAIALADATGDYGAPACVAATRRYMQLHAFDVRSGSDAPACLRRPVRRGTESYEVAWGPNEFTPLGTLAGWDYTERLRELTVPALVISGTDDLSTPLVAKTMFDAIPDARWELFPDARHMCFVDAHDEYEDLLRAWCAEHD